MMEAMRQSCEWQCGRPWAGPGCGSERRRVLAYTGGQVAVGRRGHSPVSIGEGDESSVDEEGEVASGGALTSGEPTEWGLGVYISSGCGGRGEVVGYR